MKLDGCVIFDDGRVLHGRKAFQVADVGKDRWLRGAYVDKDPFMSNSRALAYRFSTTNRLAMVDDADAEAAAAAAS